jgi:ribosome-binding protein aMBF1 (putative translation factor)
MNMTEYAAKVKNAVKPNPDVEANIRNHKLKEAGKAKKELSEKLKTLDEQIREFEDAKSHPALLRVTL